MIVNFPTLEEYITLSNRLVTPIYPTDAAAIVTLLDLHVTPPTSDNFEPMEILEAGTGHGSLTLHLARAMHAANANPHYQGVTLHTIEKEAKVSNLASENIQNFRRGMYSKGVEFYVGDVEEWLKMELNKRAKKATPEAEQSKSEDVIKHDKSQQRDSEGCDIVSPPSEPRRKTAFLTAALLDLPSPLPVLPLLAQALHPDAFLGYFAPSITQIVKLYTEIQMQRLPFILEKVVEFGNGMGGGSLRQWDVRLAKIRSREKAQQEAAKIDGTEQKQSTNKEDDHIHNSSLYETVCRPKVGGIVQGGGFYVVVRRMGDFKANMSKTKAASSDAQVVDTSSEVDVMSESASDSDSVQQTSDAGIVDGTVEEEKTL